MEHKQIIQANKINLRDSISPAKDKTMSLPPFAKYIYK